MNTTIKKIVREVYLGHEFTTNDLVSFKFCAQKRLLFIEELGNGEIIVDMTQHSMEMLYELFKYILEDNGDHLWVEDVSEDVLYASKTIGKLQNMMKTNC